jgi:mono/diheme cytochrome c family protein
VYDPRVVGWTPCKGLPYHGGKVLKINALTIALVALGALAMVSLWSRSAQADVAAGKARFNAACGQCHDSADFENENPQALAATLHRIVSGELKHKKPLQLSDQEIADIAAYMSTGGK